MNTSTRFRKTIKNLYLLLDPKQKRNFILILFIMTGSSALTQFTPKAIGWLTDDILSQTSIQFIKVIPVLLLILIVTVFNELLKILRRILVEDTATKTEKKARNLAIVALLKAPLSYFKEHMTGNIHGRLNRCLEGTINLEKLLFMDFAPAVFNSIAAIIVILLTLPVALALPMLLVIPIRLAIVIRQISTQKGIRIELLHTKTSMDGTVVELLNGIETIRMTDSIQTEQIRFDSKSEFLRTKEMKHHLQMAKYDSLKFMNEAFFTVLMIGVSAYLATIGMISVGSVLTSYLCFSQLIKPLEELHRILDELSESLILADDFFSITEIPNDFSYISTAAKPAKTSSGPLLILQHLTFGYQKDRPILNDFHLTIERGTFWGIAGPSGCGKSSLIKAICKLEPCEGKLILDGKNIMDISRSELSEIIALVPQNPFLIAGTIYENICYGLTRTPSSQEVQEAIESSCLSDFIASLPEGLHTRLAEGGTNLSGGQKQRIAIARIFLRNPQLLILDEATSALDNTSERLIQHSIEALKTKRNMTIISIAHRLTTLKNCDTILVMDQGKIVQKGTFNNLLDTPGIFADMYHGKLK